MEKRCVLDEDKICNECGECQRCDLDPNKVCDNCMKCVSSGADYAAVEIDEIIDDGTGLEEFGHTLEDLENLKNREDPK